MWKCGRQENGRREIHLEPEMFKYSRNYLPYDGGIGKA